MTARPAGRGLRETLSNPKADRIKQIAALAGRAVSGAGAGAGAGGAGARTSTSAGRAARERSGQFLVEGPQAVRELVAHRADLIRDLYVNEAALAAHAGIVDAALEAEVFVHPVTDDVSAAISPDSQGIAAVARMGDLGVVRAEGTDATDRATPEFITERLVSQGARLVAIFSDVRDPGNAGTVIRVADAAGADLVMLAGESVEIFNPKVVRATAGSLFHIPVMRGIAVADAVAAAQAAGLQVLAADGGGELELGDRTKHDPAAGLDLARPTAWLFGNEAHGLSAEDVLLADLSVRIPLFGKAESLNLAAAAAVALYASALAQH